MVDHLVVGYRKQIRFTFFSIDTLPVAPHFLKSRLHHITGVFFMAKILYNKTIHIVCIFSYAYIIFFFSHKQSRKSPKLAVKPGIYSNTGELRELLHGLTNNTGWAKRPMVRWWAGFCEGEP